MIEFEENGFEEIKRGYVIETDLEYYADLHNQRNAYPLEPKQPGKPWKVHIQIVEQIWLQKRPRNGSKWSTEYHICYYVSNCSSWSVVFKSSVCHLVKPGKTPVFKMASKMTACYKNASRKENKKMHVLFSFYA